MGSLHLVLSHWSALPIFLDRSFIADINVIYRTQDSFNTGEGKEIVIYMRCIIFTLSQSNYFFLYPFRRKER